MQLNEFAFQAFATLPLAPRTKGNYKEAYRRYIEAPMGSLDINFILRSDIQQLISTLPPQTAYQVLMVLKTLFREMDLAGLVDTRPTAGVPAPRISVPPSKFLVWDDIANAQFGPRGRYTEHVRFLALHGLRWGEAAALKESDIFDGRVHVERSLNGPPKSAAGVRSVPYLGHFRPFSHDRRPLARALSPHGVTIHSLRKTYAYMLKCSHVHVTTAQKLMGHASATVTLAIYTLVLDHEIDSAGDLIKDTFQIL